MIKAFLKKQKGEGFGIWQHLLDGSLVFIKHVIPFHIPCKATTRGIQIMAASTM